MAIDNAALGPVIPIAAVNAVLINPQREVLLTRRSMRVREPGKWCLPGGHVELGETWAEALRREVREEVGVRVETAKLMGIYSDPRLTVTSDPVGRGFHGQFVVAVFVVSRYMGEIRTNDEVDDWDWFSLDNLPEPMLKSHPIRVEDALKFDREVFIR